MCALLSLLHNTCKVEAGAVALIIPACVTFQTFESKTCRDVDSAGNFSPALDDTTFYYSSPKNRSLTTPEEGRLTGAWEVDLELRQTTSGKEQVQRKKCAGPEQYQHSSFLSWHPSTHLRPPPNRIFFFLLPPQRTLLCPAASTCSALNSFPPDGAAIAIPMRRPVLPPTANISHHTSRECPSRLAHIPFAPLLSLQFSAAHSTSIFWSRASSSPLLSQQPTRSI